MPKRRSNARGRWLGRPNCSAIRSYSRSAFAADGRSVTPKISTSSLSNQYRTGVPRSRCQLAQSSRQAARARSSGSGPSPTPSASSGTPPACSSRVT